MNMGYDLMPKKKGVNAKSGMVFTWPIILPLIPQHN